MCIRDSFIDAENAIDPTYAKNLGVNIDDLILSQPDSGEQALDITAVSYTHLDVYKRQSYKLPAPT